MHSATLIAVLAAVLPALAEELRATICGPIVTLTNTCDVDPNESGGDDDEDRRRRSIHLRDSEDAEEAIEANCICTNKSFDVGSVMALCSACIAQNGGKTEDTSKMMAQCSFASMSYVPTATALVAGVQRVPAAQVLLPEARLEEKSRQRLDDYAAVPQQQVHVEPLGDDDLAVEQGQAMKRALRRGPSRDPRPVVNGGDAPQIELGVGAVEHRTERGRFAHSPASGSTRGKFCEVSSTRRGATPSPRVLCSRAHLVNGGIW